MSETQRQVIQECFDGDRERDCEYCPAHYTKNGKCCFGTEFDENDNRCSSCNHNYHCSIETADHQERSAAVERPRRIMVNRGGSPSPSPRLPIYGQPQERTVPRFRPQPTRQPIPRRSPQTQQENDGLLVPSEKVLRHLGEHGVPQIIQPVEQMEGFWKNMGLHAAWGAGEGMLEMLLGFMRNRRPL